MWHRTSLQHILRTEKPECRRTLFHTPDSHWWFILCSHSTMCSPISYHYSVFNLLDCFHESVRSRRTGIECYISTPSTIICPLNIIVNINNCNWMNRWGMLNGISLSKPAFTILYSEDLHTEAVLLFLIPRYSLYLDNLILNQITTNLTISIRPDDSRAVNL